MLDRLVGWPVVGWPTSVDVQHAVGHPSSSVVFHQLLDWRVEREAFLEPSLVCLGDLALVPYSAVPAASFAAGR